jgi:hypothetical protein
MFITTFPGMKYVLVYNEFLYYEHLFWNSPFPMITQLHISRLSVLLYHVEQGVCPTQVFCLLVYYIYLAEVRIHFNLI